MKLKITIIVFLLSIVSYGQVSNEGEPQSWRLSNMENVEAIKMPKFNLAKIQEEDKLNDAKGDRPFRFGHEFIVDHNLNNSGNWYTLPNGDRIWRIRYTSEGAKSLNFLFSDFYMPRGASVYLYNNDKTNLLGAYDEKQNNDKRVLGTWLVNGEDIWIEYYEPAAVAGQGKLEVFKVVHGYRTVAPDGGINMSEDCHYDVDCSMAEIDALKDISKKSVALIIVNNSNWCTGALINNTANDGTPYFLTADHCYSDPAEWSFMFNWISPNPVCASPEESTNNAPDYLLTASGATLRARRADSDFMLVEMNFDIPAEWDRVWAGWDRSTTAPNLIYGIHHPSGDIMKVSMELDSPQAVTNNEGGIVWDIPSWDFGGLEPGSSGSPLFDHNGRIRGQAWYIYGSQICDGTAPGGLGSGYGRFDASWDAGNTPQTRLREWLDPQNTGITRINSWPPQGGFEVDAEVLLENANDFECTNQINPQVRLINNGSENLVSAQINYTVNEGEPGMLNWEGNLSQDESIVIDLPVLTGTSELNNYNISVSNPNAAAVDGNTNNNNVSGMFGEGQTLNENNLIFSITTDEFGYEVSWELKDNEGNILYSVGEWVYSNNATYENQFNLTDGCYTLTIKDGFGDGICCENGNGSYILTTENDVFISQGGDYGTSTIIPFKIEGSMDIDVLSNNLFTIHPNPSSGIFMLSSNQHTSGAVYSIHNMLGQTIKKGTFSLEQNMVDLSDAAKGMYIIKIDTANGKSFSAKLIKE